MSRRSGDNSISIWGLHAVAGVLARAPESMLEVCIMEGRNDRRVEALMDKFRSTGVAVSRVPKRTLDRMTDGGAHQGIVARCRPQREVGEDDLRDILDRLEEPALLLVLDGIQDPHNLGACLRTADAVGVHAVIAPRDGTVGLTSVVRKTASGAAETVPFVRVTNLARTLRWLKERGIWTVGTAEDAPVSIYQADLGGPLAIVMGSEGKGLRRLTREHCDVLAEIPMRGEVESLNVSVATGVCLYLALQARAAAE